MTEYDIEAKYNAVTAVCAEMTEADKVTLFSLLLQHAKEAVEIAGRDDAWDMDWTDVPH